jgi:hypothetical protein
MALGNIENVQAIQPSQGGGHGAATAQGAAAASSAVYPLRAADAMQNQQLASPAPKKVAFLPPSVQQWLCVDYQNV